MTISPDAAVLWRWGPVGLNETIVFTWQMMALLTIGAWLITRRLTSDARLSRWQNLLEVVVTGMRNQIPVVGDRVDLPGCVVEVATMEDHRVVQVRLMYLKQASKQSKPKRKPITDKDKGGSNSLIP